MSGAIPEAIPGVISGLAGTVDSCQPQATEPYVGFMLGDRPCTIGRSTSRCDLILPLPDVSRVHVEEACRRLGMSKSTIHEWIHRHDSRRPT